MNEKLIMRAGRDYRSWMLRETNRMMSQSLDALHDLDCVANKTKEIQKLTNKFQRSVLDDGTDVETARIVMPSIYKSMATHLIPEIKQDIIQSLTVAVNKIKDSANPQDVITPLSLSGAYEEIRVINDLWPKTEYRNGILTVIIRDVTLSDENEDVDLGDFSINLNLTNPLNGLDIISLTQVLSQKGHCHPHVNGTHLCKGEGEDATVASLQQGMLENYFHKIEVILRTYNHESPYVELSDWYDPDHEDETYCECCADWVPDESMFSCNSCESQFCENCNYGDCCSECGYFYCDDCSTYCTTCEDRLCQSSYCKKDCEICNDTVCTHCLSKCDKCDAQICSDCMEEQSCFCCGDYTCKGCVSECVDCDEIYCEECLDKTCSACDGKLCESCTKTCAECDAELCRSCKINCEECGVTACPECGKQHKDNCLLSEVKNV